MDRRSLITGIVASLPSLAFARNYIEDEDATINEWYKKAMQNHGRSSCCGLGDAFWCDKLEILPNVDYFFATVTDDKKIPGRPDWNGYKIKISNSLIDKRYQGNPTGHNVLFAKPNDGEQYSNLSSLIRKVADKDYYDEEDIIMYCFFPNQGL